MQIIFVVISLAWSFSAYRLLRQKILVSEQGLMVNFLLLTVAWAGLNTLFGLIQLFDFMESIDQDLLSGFIQDKALLGWILFYFINGLSNMIFGAFLLLGQIRKAEGRTVQTLASNLNG